MSKLLRNVAALSMAVLVSSLLGSVAAKAAPASQSTLPADVLQTEWMLQYFNTDAKAAGHDVTSSHITIKFEADGTLSGSGGCNSYGGSYTVSGQKLTISDKLISTQMACPDPAMSNESLYLRLLPTVNGYALHGGTLDLIYADGHNAMTFTSGSDQTGQAGQGGTQALPSEVLHTEWSLRYFNSNARVAQDVPGAGITIKFAADGTLSGYSGCNNYSGSYTVSGQQMTIGENLATTRMACPPAQITLEGRYLQILPTVKSYSITATELQLVYAQDGAALVYSPAATQLPEVQPVAGMPNTGGGIPPLMTFLLAGSLVVLVTGFLLRSVRRGEGARKQS